MRALILVALAACTYEEKVFEGPFTCLGEQPPGSAPPNITISGTIVDPLNNTPVIAATVDLQPSVGNTILTRTTDLSGRFSFDLPTTGVPVVGFDLYTHAFNYLDSYYFPSRPLAADFDQPISILSTTEASALFSTSGLTMDTTAGTALMTVNDCVMPPVKGASVTSTPPGHVVYFTSVNPAPAATATDAGGVVMVANIPPGKATLRAMADGHEFAPHDVTIVAGAITVTELQP